MAGTTNVPLQTLPIGSYDVGPIDLDDSDTWAVITIDRTPAGGFNDLTSATYMQIGIEQSDDGGASWYPNGSATMVGGVFINKYTGLVTGTSAMGVLLGVGNGRKARGTVVVNGTSVAIAGTVVIT
jgi:hypothetical protein